MSSSVLSKVCLGFTLVLNILLISCASDETLRDVRKPVKNSAANNRPRAFPRSSTAPPIIQTPLHPTHALQPPPLANPTVPATPTPTPPPPPALSTIMETDSASVPAHIGLVVPLSGPLAPIGAQILRGARLGLNLEKGFDSAFQIFLVDSELPEPKLREELDNLVYRDQVITIMGAGKNVNILSEVAEKARVPTILFSQRTPPSSETEIFRNFLTTEAQIIYLVSELRAQGAQRFAVLYPNDNFGTEATNFFWDAVLASGGQVVAAEIYDPKEHDFRLPVQRLVGLDDVAARAAEYKANLKTWQEQNANKRNLKDPAVADLLKPWVDFDAVFIPDSVQNLGQITAMLSFQNVRDLKVVGLNLWDTPDLLKRVDGKFNPILFVDDFTTLDEAGQRHPFTNFYRTRFHFDPQTFDVLGFETAAAFKKMINRGVRNREAMRQEIARFSDPRGMFGSLSVNAEREFEGPTQLFTLSDGLIHRND